MSCKPRLVRVHIGNAVIAVDARAKAAFVALADVFYANNYTCRPDDTGAYNCRSQKGSKATSSHAWGIAVDTNWRTNPYRTDRLETDLPAHLIADATDIRTADGWQCFRWGGDWDGRPGTPHSNYDAMHFELIVTPDELAAGVLLPRRFLAMRYPIGKAVWVPGRGVIAIAADGSGAVYTDPPDLYKGGFNTLKPDQKVGREDVEIVDVQADSAGYSLIGDDLRVNHWRF